MEIVKAVIPAAGFGTRFLPYTKTCPKEMIPLLNKPAIQYIIEEGLASSISHFCMITRRDKQALENYFDTSPELDRLVQGRPQQELLKSIEKIIKTAQFNYIRQHEPLGLGHAVWLARTMIDKEYFSIFLPDDIIDAKTPAIAQLMQIARQEKASVVAVQEVPLDQVSNYGIISIKKQLSSDLFQVANMIEKPSIRNAPSNLAVIGRYVLSYKIFKALDTTFSHATGGELQLTDGITQMMHDNEKVLAYKIQGTRHDIGTPLGWLKATIDMSLQSSSYGTEIKNYLFTQIKEKI